MAQVQQRVGAGREPGSHHSADRRIDGRGKLERRGRVANFARRARRPRLQDQRRSSRSSWSKGHRRFGSNGAIPSSGSIQTMTVALSDPAEVIAMRRDRVTLRKTLVSCAVLAGALVLAVILLSLVGSERLPAGASLCAL